MEPIKGFKGFDKNLKCRDFQYEVGKTYEITDKPVRCTNHGFHFCENPLDIFGYYDPANSVFHEVTGSGDVDTSTEDSKIAVSKIKIGAEISLFSIIKLGIDIILKKAKDTKKDSGDSSAAVNSGYRSAAVNSGDSSAAVNSGDSSAAVNSGYSSAAVNSGDSSAAVNSGYRSAAVNSGYRSAAEVTNKNSLAVGFGIYNKAKACLGSYICLAEWEQNESYEWNIKHLKSAKIDGKKLLADTWYILENGKFTKA